nr:MAG TPA: hypothetical protein [Caudoviricetes sp.]
MNLEFKFIVISIIENSYKNLNLYLIFINYLNET